jgi:hypothetical protein
MFCHYDKDQWQSNGNSERVNSTRYVFNIHEFTNFIPILNMNWFVSINQRPRKIILLSCFLRARSNQQRNQKQDVSYEKQKKRHEARQFFEELAVSRMVKQSPVLRKPNVYYNVQKALCLALSLTNSIKPAASTRISLRSKFLQPRCFLRRGIQFREEGKMKREN